MAHGGTGLAVRYAGVGPRLRTGCVVDLFVPRIRHAGLGNRPVVQRLGEPPANPGCRCRTRRVPDPGRCSLLPFAAEFFDAIACIDSFPYYGTDDLYLNYLARFLKPGGPVGIAGAGLMREIEGPPPEHLREWWTQDLWCLHSADWWRRHWERTGIVEVHLADAMPEGWQVWLDYFLTTKRKSRRLRPIEAAILATSGAWVAAKAV